MGEGLAWFQLYIYPHPSVCISLPQLRQMRRVSFSRRVNTGPYGPVGSLWLWDSVSALLSSDLLGMIVFLTLSVLASHFKGSPGPHYAVIITRPKMRETVCTHAQHSSCLLCHKVGGARCADKLCTWNNGRYSLAPWSLASAHSVAWVCSAMLPLYFVFSVILRFYVIKDKHALYWSISSCGRSLSGIALSCLWETGKLPNKR